MHFATPISSMIAAAACCCLLLLLATTAASSLHGQQNERDALLSFKAGIVEDPQSLLSSWNGQDCCLWSGVKCSNRTGHVNRLNLRNDFFFDDIVSWNSRKRHRIHEEISSSLLALHHLEYLDLSGNYLGGVGVPIPRFLGSLESLLYLNLSCVNFDGKVPPQLGNLARLLYLDLYNEWHPNGKNELHVEDISWLARLSLLKFLDMSYVNLSTIGNWVQVLNMLPNLRALRLEDCRLVFPKTSVVNSNLTPLRMLDLSNNWLHTLNPTYWFWDVDTIRHLDLSGNGIDEPFPDTMGNMTSLEALHLGYNHLTIVKSKALKDLCNLRMLTLQENWINQDMSEFLEVLPHCVWSKMELLDLSKTNLSGEILKWINQWTDLSIFKLSSNRLVGSVPLEIGV